jgi:hypothetical protein
MLRFFNWMAFLGVFAAASLARADIPLPQPVKDCHYLSRHTVQVKSCAGTQVCFAQMQCGFKVTPVSCLAKNGQCPENPKDCAQDPQVEFVAKPVPPPVMNSNGLGESVSGGGQGK